MREGIAISCLELKEFWSLTYLFIIPENLLLNSKIRTDYVRIFVFLKTRIKRI